MHNAAYERLHGRRKCESNALVRDSETIKAAELTCREAIEEYLGKDALARFKAKEGAAKRRFSRVLRDPAWAGFSSEIDRLVESLTPAHSSAKAETEAVKREEEENVIVRRGYYGCCPQCQTRFEYSDDDNLKLRKCRSCGVNMRLYIVDSPQS